MKVHILFILILIISPMTKADNSKNSSSYIAPIKVTDAITFKYIQDVWIRLLVESGYQGKENLNNNYFEVLEDKSKRCNFIGISDSYNDFIDLNKNYASKYSILVKEEYTKRSVKHKTVIGSNDCKAIQKIYSQEFLNRLGG